MAKIKLSFILNDESVVYEDEIQDDMAKEIFDIINPCRCHDCINWSKKLGSESGCCYLHEKATLPNDFCINHRVIGNTNIFEGKLYKES